MLMGGIWMLEFLRNYFIALLTFFVIDIVWLVVIAKKLYQDQLGFIMSDKPNWFVAVLFYLIFVVGLVFFVINPAIERESISYAIFVGMLFGFITYSTYDLTNLATLKDWPVMITVIDLIWGSSLGALVSMITYLVVRLFK